MKVKALAGAPAMRVRAADPDAALVAAARAQPGEFLALHDRYFDRVQHLDISAGEFTARDRLDEPPGVELDLPRAAIASARLTSASAIAAGSEAVAAGRLVHVLQFLWAWPAPRLYGIACNTGVTPSVG